MLSIEHSRASHNHPSLASFRRFLKVFEIGLVLGAESSVVQMTSRKIVVRLACAAAETPVAAPTLLEEDTVWTKILRRAVHRSAVQRLLKVIATCHGRVPCAHAGGLLQNHWRPQWWRRLRNDGEQGDRGRGVRGELGRRCAVAESSIQILFRQSSGELWWAAQEAAERARGVHRGSDP